MLGDVGILSSDNYDFLFSPKSDKSRWTLTKKLDEEKAKNQPKPEIKEVIKEIPASEKSYVIYQLFKTKFRKNKS